MSGPSDALRGRRLVWATRSPGRVVARYADGQILKGYACDFDPDQPRFHLTPAHGPPDQAVEVWLKDLKALFFVRSFEGDPHYEESRDLYQPRPAGTRKVRLEFEDGEILVGYTTGPNPPPPGGGRGAGGVGGPEQMRDARTFGLFVTPMDRRSNNRRVFAVSSAVAGLQRLL
jgi:hypothetical protein